MQPPQAGQLNPPQNIVTDQNPPHGRTGIFDFLSYVCGQKGVCQTDNPELYQLPVRTPAQQGVANVVCIAHAARKQLQLDRATVKCLQRDRHVPVMNKEFVVPRGDTVIESGDHVVFVGPTSAIQKADELFTIKS